MRIARVNFFSKDINFYYLMAICLVAIIFTHPFLRYPYDIFYHLIQIDKYYETNSLPVGRDLWHFLWAKFFYIFGIQNNEILLRAKIIHVIQTYIAFLSVYYFSNVVIRNLFKNIDKSILRYLSFWAVLIWISIFATFSMYYHLVWNLWYSVNYQVTLPLFWYITALTLVLFLEDTSLKKKIFFIVQILVISRFILQVHSMEYVYYLMYMFTFAIINIDKTWYFLKKYFYIFIPIIMIVVYFAKQYQPEKSKIFNYLDFGKLPLLYQKIIQEGGILVSGSNRAFASINELMYLILFIGVIVTTIVIKNRVKNEIDFRNFIFILVTSLFVLIPLYEFSGGLLGIITRENVVNRLYYSSSLFVLLPVFVYYLNYLLFKGKINIFNINFIMIVLLSCTYVYSKYNIYGTQNYYKNVKSIKNSFFERKIGFNLSKEQIDMIGEKLKEYEINNNSGKPEYYYARADISFVIKYIYRKNVYWEDRRANPDYINIYNGKNKNNEFQLILFETPKGFPDYEPYK